MRTKSKIIFNASMFLTLVLLLVLNIHANENDGELYVPDGQLSTRLFKVFVPDRQISDKMEPELNLRSPVASDTFSYAVVASNQKWIRNYKGAEYSATGSVVLFDISKIEKPGFTTGLRVLPVLSWNEVNDSTGVVSTSRALGDHEVYIGNLNGAILYTVLIFLLFFLFAYLLTMGDEEKIIGLLTTVEGSINIALVQMALWTIAIGFMVLLFGLMHLKVPQIPSSLVILMGLSVGTSAVGHIQAHKLQKTAVVVDKGSLPNRWQRMLMIQVDKEFEPSLAKAQMLFWTLITLVIFIWKSFSEGQLWDVPTELIFLMGISQVTFLGRQVQAINEGKNKGTGNSVQAPSQD